MQVPGEGFDLGPFHLTTPLARGGMGEVWAATHRETQEHIAVKVITADFARHPDFQDSLRREVHAMAQLHHPAIVRVLDHGEVDGHAASSSNHALIEGSPYIAMERIYGSTLADYVLALPWDDVRALLLKLLDALAHAHSRDVLHRDLKPANILLSDTGTTWDIKLTDFGVAQPLHIANNVGPRVAGTPMFMSPEQCRGEWRAYRPATDLYAVGRIASAMLERRQGKAHVPIGFEAWLDCITADVPQQRFAMAADAAHALGRLPRASTWIRLAEVGDAMETTLRVDAPRPKQGLSGEVQTPAQLGRDRPPVPSTWEAARTAHAPKPLQNAGASLLHLRAFPLVGRTRERGRLWSALVDTHNRGSLGLVTLEGPEGIGRRSLARWFTRRAYEVGAGWPHHASFDPVVSGMDTLCGMVAREMKTVGLPHLQAHERIRRLAELYGFDDPYDLEGLAEMSNPKSMSEDGFRFAHRAEKLSLLGRFLRWGASARPLLLHIEDLQWSMDGLDLIETLLDEDQMVPLPILVVATVDSKALTMCHFESRKLARLQTRLSDRSTRIALPTLSDRHHRTMLNQILSLDPTLTAEITRRAMGHPGTAIATLAELHSGGHLQPGTSGFRLKPGHAMNSDVDADGVLRLKRFMDGRSAQSCVSLELLAVLGPAAQQEDWVALCRRSGLAPKRHLVDEMVEKGFLRFTRGGQIQFTKAAYLDHVLDQAERHQRRSAHHVSCADLLANTNVAGDQNGAIGQHLLSAGHPKRALRHLSNGLRRALRTGRISRATELATSWHQAVHRLELPPTHPLHGEGTMLLARIDQATGRLTDAQAKATALRAKAMEHGWRESAIQAAALLGRISYFRGRHAEADRLLITALEEAEGLPPNRSIADAWFDRARISVRLQTPDATALYIKNARRVYREMGDLHGEPRCLLLAVQTADQAGRLDEALTLASAARAMAREVHDTDVEASAWVAIGEIHRRENRLDDAEAAYRTSIRLLRRLGNPRRTVIGDLNLAVTLAQRDQHEQARALFESCIERCSALDMTSYIGIAHALSLPTFAALQQAVAFDRQLERAHQRLGASEHRETDTIDALRDAHLRCVALGWDGLAMRTQALIDLLLA